MEGAMAGFVGNYGACGGGRRAVRRCVRRRGGAVAGSTWGRRRVVKGCAAAEVVADDVMELTLDNVEAVLDELRPYLIADGGNCSVQEIDGATVKLMLEGACGSCPSSAVTMSMGIEKRLKEKIPEIEAVVQVSPQGPDLDEENVEKVGLKGSRPLIRCRGGSIRPVRFLTVRFAFGFATRLG